MSVGLEANEANTILSDRMVRQLPGFEITGENRILKITGSDGVSDAGGNGVSGISAAGVSGPRCRRFGRPPLLIDPEASPVHNQSTRTRRPLSHSEKKFLMISVCIQLLPGGTETGDQRWSVTRES